MTKEERDEVWEQILDESKEFELECAATGLYHRGWRFWPPYACHSCGCTIGASQFAFARACGGCDVGASRTIRLHPGDKGWFILGRVQLENANDEAFIRPEFIAATQALEHPRIMPRKPALPRPPTPPRPRPNPRLPQPRRG